MPSDVSLTAADTGAEGRTNAKNKEKRKSDERDKDRILRLLTMHLGK